MIVTCDFRINLFRKSQITVKHSKILKYHNLIQHIEKPTRSGTKSIDQKSSSLTKLTSQNVLPYGEISDHDYVIINIRKQRFEPWYKYIRDENQFNSKMFKESAAALSLSLGYTMYDPEDTLDIFKKLVPIVHMNMPC